MNTTSETSLKNEQFKDTKPNGRLYREDGKPLIKISYFGSYFSKKRNKYVPGGKPTETDFYTEMERIKNGYYSSIINELKSITDPAKQKEFKASKLPSFTTSCFIKDWREEKNIINHSGLLNIDIDGDENTHVDDWREMRDRLCDMLPTIVAAFVSARGNGLSFIVKIKPEQHEETYNSISFHLQRVFLLYCDPSCKNITRLRFVSHDQEAVINYDFDKIPVVIPSAEYKEYQSKLPPLNQRRVAAANSKELFENAINYTEHQYRNGEPYKFKDGEKYWYLITVAGYCNARGMSEDCCKTLVQERFGNLTKDDILKPITDIYGKYDHQHGSVPFNDPKNDMELLRQQAKIDLSKKVNEPPVLLEIACTQDYQRFATAGNFSLIIGKAKSRKTFFVAMIVAALAKDKLLMGKFMPRLSAQRRKVIVFDTEQAIYDVQLLNERVLKIAGVKFGDEIEFYHLRTLDTKQRIDLIEFILYNTPNLSFVIIDGIRDLIFDINSPEEASFISNKLLKWTEEINIHIVTVLHQNKADNNARGHVGTELINKAESVLSIAKDQKLPELSIVTPEYFRGKEFKPFAFRINSDGLPEITDEFLQTSANDNGQQRKAILAHQIQDEQHKNILSGIFVNGTAPRYKELITLIKLSFQQFGVSFGDNKAGEILTYWKNKNWIEPVKESVKRFPVYKLCESL